MKGIVLKIYIGLQILCFLVLVYMFATFRKDVSQVQVSEGYEVPTDYTYCQYEDASAPAGVRDEYRFTFSEIDGSYRNLFFYTVHQNAEVFVGGKRVYRMRPLIINDFGRTPGCVWNSVALDNRDSGKEVLVVVYPVYKSAAGVSPSFYFGDKYEISMDVILRQLPTLLLSVIGILTGFIFVAYAIYNFKNSEMDKSLLLLGFFALFVSLWKLTDNEAMYLLFPNVQALYMAPFLMLHLVSAPFVLFMREFYSTRESKIWYVPVVTSFAGLTLTLGLQLMNVCDMRQMLWVIHVEIAVTVIVTCGNLIYEFVKKGLNAKMKRNVVFMAICLLGMLADMAMYYLSRGMAASALGMLGFIIYIFSLGAFAVKDAKELMDFGVQARTFERKAYHDQLTGLYNRMAYADYISRESFSSERCIVAVFDLNNLKKCNDTLGHEKGDIYIKECAHIIQETFQDIGRCYRMGGDEFTVLLEQVSLDVCKKRLQRMQEAVEERNRKNPEIEMGIAFGYELFDKRIDHDINDTSRRADKKMYREKFSMKQAKAASEA